MSHLPENGRGWNDLAAALEQRRSGDADWQHGRTALFIFNAGEQVHRLTGAIQSQLDRLEKAGRLAEIPPILAFQSGVRSIE